MPHVVNHPVVQANLTALRDTRTDATTFRRLLHDLSLCLFHAATANLATSPATVQTPLTSARGVTLAHPITLVPILRAGLGMLNGIHDAVPQALVGHIGLVRDEDTAVASQYYCKLPAEIASSDVFLLDPMLATGGSALQAAHEIKNTGASRLHFVCLIAAPEGLATFEAAHPDVPVTTASVDSHLDENAYIVPGLGDAGDRYFNTA